MPSCKQYQMHSRKQTTVEWHPQKLLSSTNQWFLGSRGISERPRTKINMSLSMLLRFGNTVTLVHLFRPHTWDWKIWISGGLLMGFGIMAQEKEFFQVVFQEAK